MLRLLLTQGSKNLQGNFCLAVYYMYLLVGNKSKCKIMTDKLVFVSGDKLPTYYDAAISKLSQIQKPRK